VRRLSITGWVEDRSAEPDSRVNLKRSWSTMVKLKIVQLNLPPPMRSAN
jgi:hypothetical protein